jgi:hypothetical protein
VLVKCERHVLDVRVVRGRADQQSAHRVADAVAVRTTGAAVFGERLGMNGDEPALSAGPSMQRQEPSEAARLGR